MSRVRSTASPIQLAVQSHAAGNESARVLGLTWYRQYPGDLLSTARGWSMVALGTFHALRDSQWDLGSLPADPSEIRRLLRIEPREWKAAWACAESHFPIDADGRRRNPWLASERFEALGKRWQQIDAARIKHGDGYAGASADAYAAAHPTADASARPSGDASAPADARALQLQLQLQHQLQSRLTKETLGSRKKGSSPRSGANGPTLEHDS